jgi:hypothetical protein
MRPPRPLPGDHPWSTYFGEKHNPYPTSSLSLPEIYKGHNPYLTTILIDLVTEEDTVPTKIILPIREVDNTDLTITWDKFHFSKSLLGPVPEEGVIKQLCANKKAYSRFSDYVVQLKTNFRKANVSYSDNNKNTRGARPRGRRGLPRS